MLKETTNMSKKLIYSLSVIAAAAVVVVGATTAYFNDTETSTGNTFTAGAIDLTVDSLGAWYNGQQIPDSFFRARDLINERFFDLGDVKPGDLVERNISLHVSNNPAWACLLIKNRQNDENDLTDPEHEAQDTTPGDVNGLGNGELGKNMRMLGWIDSDADGKLNNGEQPFVDSFFDVFTEIALHDSTTNNGSLNPEIPVEMIQMDLCGGTLAVAGDGTVICNGNSMGDQSQTDKLTANLQLYVEQVRNNPNFKCSDLGGGR